MSPSSSRVQAATAALTPGLASGSLPLLPRPDLPSHCTPFGVNLPYVLLASLLSQGGGKAVMTFSFRGESRVEDTPVSTRHTRVRPLLPSEMVGGLV